MADPLGLIGSGNNPLRGVQGAVRPPAGGVSQDPSAPSFKDVLLDNINKVNQLQQEATTATEDLVTGKRNDLEGVLLATQKADTAFRMLLAVRNKVQQAYEEVKQVRI
jgi:flagellar hook-basal body complex protein FliE